MIASKPLTPDRSRRLNPNESKSCTPELPKGIQAAIIIDDDLFAATSKALQVSGRQPSRRFALDL